MTAPLAVLAAIEVLEAFELLPGRWGEIAYGLGLAVVVASFGGAVAGGVLAPDAPWRRLIAVDDAAASTFARHLVWGARALGVLLFAFPEIGLIGIADTLKPGAPAAVAELGALGLDVWMLTGDSWPTATTIASQAGIVQVMAEVLPGQKAEKVRELQAQGRRVAMGGDGVNDAPALAQANLGIAIGTGADVALAASDVTLVGGGLGSIVTAIALSRRTVGAIKQGLFWAFAYNVLLIPIAMGVTYPVFHVLLNPVLAAARGRPGR